MITATVLAAAAVTVAVYREEIKTSFVDDGKYSRHIAAAASKYAIDSRLLKAVIFQESRFDRNARGRDGEIGLMQIIPATAVEDWARVHKVKPPQPGMLFAPEVNIEIGTWYLSRALRKWRDYKHGTELALCEYNAGGSRAEKWCPESYDAPVMDRIAIASTKNYVRSIMRKYREYCAVTSE